MIKKFLRLPHHSAIFTKTLTGRFKKAIFRIGWRYGKEGSVAFLYLKRE